MMIRPVDYSLVLSLVVIALCSVGCSHRPDGILSEKATIELLTDMTIAESYEQSSSASELPDSLRRHLGEGVMRAHGVDRALFDSTMAWYGRNLDDYTALYAEVDKRLASRLREETGASPQDNSADDLWPLQRHYWFTPLSGGRPLIFEIPGEAAGAGESLEWSIALNSNADTDLLLGVDYNDGTSSFVKRNFRGDKRPKMTLVADTGKVIKRIFGTITVPKRSLPLWIDSVRLVKNPYDSAAYAASRWNQKRYYGPRRSRQRVDKDTVSGAEDNSGNAADNADNAVNSGNRGTKLATEEEFHLNSRTGPGSLIRDGKGASASKSVTKKSNTGGMN